MKGTHKWYLWTSLHLRSVWERKSWEACICSINYTLNRSYWTQPTRFLYLLTAFTIQHYIIIFSSEFGHIMQIGVDCHSS